MRPWWWLAHCLCVLSGTCPNKCSHLSPLCTHLLLPNPIHWSFFLHFPSRTHTLTHSLSLPLLLYDITWRELSLISPLACPTQRAWLLSHMMVTYSLFSQLEEDMRLSNVSISYYGIEFYVEIPKEKGLLNINGYVEMMDAFNNYAELIPYP